MMNQKAMRIGWRRNDTQGLLRHFRWSIDAVKGFKKRVETPVHLRRLIRRTQPTTVSFKKDSPGPRLQAGNRPADRRLRQPQPNRRLRRRATLHQRPKRLIFRQAVPRLAAHITPCESLIKV